MNNAESFSKIISDSRKQKPVTVIYDKELVLGHNSLNILFSEAETHGYNAYMFSQFLPLILAFDYVNRTKERVLIVSYNLNGTMLDDIINSIISFRDFELKQEEYISIPFDKANIVNVTEETFNRIDINDSSPSLFNADGETTKSYHVLKELIRAGEYGMVIFNPLISVLSPIPITNGSKVYRALLSLHGLASELKTIVLSVCGVDYNDYLKNSLFKDEEELNRFKWLIREFTWFRNNTFTNERLYRYVMNTNIDKEYLERQSKVENYDDIEPFEVE